MNRETVRMTKRCCSILVLLLIFCGINQAQAMNRGDALPRTATGAVVKAGEKISPYPVVGNDGKEVDIAFDGKPTIILQTGFIARENFEEWQKFYEKNKEHITFLVINLDGKKQLWNEKKYTMPLVSDKTMHHVRKVNNAVPSLLIVNADGIVVYNGGQEVQFPSLQRFVDALKKKDSAALPDICYEPPAEKKKEAMPELMPIGTNIQKDTFNQLNGQEITLQFRNKPTVLLFWRDFNNPASLRETFTVVQKLYEQKKEDVDFYTICPARVELVTQMLNEYGCTVPTLRCKSHEWIYNRMYPGIIVIDERGILRYRPQGTVTEERLLRLLDNVKKPYQTPKLETAAQWAQRADELSLNADYNPEEAVLAYDKAIQLEPNNANLFIKRAKCYAKSYNEAKALQDWNRAIELQPNTSELYYQRAKIYERMNQQDNANRDYETIFTKNPKEWNAVFFRANNFEKKGRWKEAIAEYSRIIEHCTPQSTAGCYYNRGLSYYKTGEYNKACEDFEQVIFLTPQDGSAYLMKGYALLGLGENLKAVEAFTKAIEVKQIDDGYVGRAKAYEKMQQYDSAIQDISNVLTRNPNHQYAYFIRGNLYGKCGLYAEAIKDLVKETQRYPRNPDSLFALAQAQERSGDFENAKKNYSDALEYATGNGGEWRAKCAARIAGDWNSYQDWIEVKL